MPQLKVLAALPILAIGLAACGEEPTETATVESPAGTSGPTAPPPRTVDAPNAAPPATMTMPPISATTPRELPAESTGAVIPVDDPLLQRFQGRPYTTGTVSLRLDPGGRFEMVEEQGSRRVGGEYALADGVITFRNPVGDLGGATFPMRCRLIESGEGFRLESVEACAPLADQDFRPAG